MSRNDGASTRFVQSQSAGGISSKQPSKQASKQANGQAGQRRRHSARTWPRGLCVFCSLCDFRICSQTDKVKRPHAWTPLPCPQMGGRGGGVGGRGTGGDIVVRLLWGVHLFDGCKRSTGWINQHQQANCANAPFHFGCCNSYLSSAFTECPESMAGQSTSLILSASRGTLSQSIGTFRIRVTTCNLNNNG